MFYRCVCLFLLLAGCCLSPLSTEAATKDNIFFMKKGLQRPQHIEKSWNQQSDQILEQQDLPYFTGTILWQGSDGSEAQSFHQWEMRLQAAGKTYHNLHLQINALGPDLKLLQKAGHWAELGTVADGAIKKVSYQLPCPAPSAYLVTLRWTGGQQQYLGYDANMLPILYPPATAESYLIVLNLNSAYDPRSNRAVITYWLRNEGGAAAENLQHIIHFFDARDQEIHRHRFKPENGTIPTHYAQEQRIEIDHCPPFSYFSVSQRSYHGQLDPGFFSDQKELQVAELLVEDGFLTATFLNNTNSDVADIETRIQFFDEAGAALDSYIIPINSAYPTEKIPIKQELTSDLKTAVHWETSILFDNPIEFDPINAGGLVFTIGKLEKKNNNLIAHMRVHNQLTKTLKKLTCHFKLEDSNAQEKISKLAIEKLDPDQDYAGVLSLSGLEDIAAISVGWNFGQ